MVPGPVGVDLNGITSTDYDRLNVTGSVLGSAAITVNSSGLSAPPHQRFTIVQASGGVAASFTVTTSPFFLVPSSSGNTVVLDPPFAVSTLTVSASPSSTVVQGQPVTFTASLDTSQGTPTGTVAFSDNGHLLATVPLNGSAVATYTTTLTAGTQQISAAYSGDTVFSPTAEPLASDLSVVTQATTTTTVGSLPATVTAGQAVTLSATVSAAAGTPTGTVTFFDNGSSLGTAALSGGQATFTTTALAVGSHTITASYGGDSSDAAGQSSNSATVTVNPVVVTTATTTTVSALPATVTAGQAVTLSATVGAASGTPTGQVTFLDHGVAIPGATVALVGGQATFTTGSLAVGAHALTVSYGGATGFAPSQSSGPAAVTVNSPPVTPPSPPTSPFGTDVTSLLNVIPGRARYFPGRKQFLQKVTIGTRSHKPLTGALAGPLQLVLQNLSSRATILKASGTVQGSPFVYFGMGGRSSVVLVLSFHARSPGAVAYTPHVLGASTTLTGATD